MEICRDLIRIDTSNYGDGSGPGERKAAEYVAGLLDEVGIEPGLFEAEPGRTTRGGPLGRAERRHARRCCCTATSTSYPRRPRLDRSTRSRARSQDGYLWGRGAVDMKDFDAMLLSIVRARARAGAEPPSGRSCSASPRTRRPAATRAPSRSSTQHPDLFEGCTEGIGEVGGFSATVRGRRIYLIEAAEKGMAWMRLTANGHGRTRVDASTRQRRHRALRGGGPDRRARVAGAADAAMKVLLAAGRRARRRRGRPRTTPRSWSRSSARPRGCSAAVIRNTANPTMLEAGYKVNVVPGEATAHVDGRFLPGFEDEFFDTLADLVGDRITIDYVSKQPAWEMTFDGDIISKMT